MQTSSQGIEILPKREAKMHLLCEENTIVFFEMEIALSPAPRVKHTEATTH